MTAIIKHAAALDDVRIRALGQTPREAASPATLALRQRVAELEQELADRTAQIEGLIEVGKEAFAEGLATGQEQARKAAAQERDDLIAVLETTSRAALDSFSRDLSSLERLAPRIAFETLDRILGDPDHMREVASKLIAHQLKSIDIGAVVRLEVAEADFPDQAELRPLREALGPNQLEIHVSAALEPGACRIKMHLGTLEVGLNQQWGHMADLLLSMAEAAE